MRDPRRRAARGGPPPGGRLRVGAAPALPALPALPAGFALVLDTGTRRPRPQLLIGGCPTRLLRLSPAGAALVSGWAAGGAIPAAPEAQRLARRLLETGIAHPRPGPAAAAPPAPAPSDVTVVIPVRDRPDGLARTLARLGAAGPVLVVDDGSLHPAPTAAVAAAGGAVTLRRDRAGGPAAARNTGWRQATTALVAFVDADCEPAPRWIEGLLPHFADPHVVAAAPRVISGASPGMPGWLCAYDRAHSSLDLGERPGPVRPRSWVPYVPSAALLVRRGALEKCGGFAEELLVGEDVDLVWRLGNGSGRVRYDPTSVVTHPARASVGSWLSQRYAYGRSAGVLAARHGGAVAPVEVSGGSVAVWVLAAGVRRRAALGVAVAAALAAPIRLRCQDAASAVALARMAAAGHMRAGASLLRTIRRAWLPPLAALAALGFAPARRALALALVGPPLRDWLRRRPAVGPLTWVAAAGADDLAYQAGVWVGALMTRGGWPALAPRWQRGGRRGSRPGGPPPVDPG